MTNILAIDPGSRESGYAVTDTAGGMKIQECGKAENNELKSKIADIVNDYGIEIAVIEMIASYGMAVGREVFDTCVWIGRFAEVLEACGVVCEYIYRKEEKMYICGDSRAKDTNIRRALIDDFARKDFVRGKGTKKEPDFFYGVSKDAWTAFAVAVTWDRKRRQGETETYGR